VAGTENGIRRIGNEFHSRLIAGDVTASAEIAEQFIPLITERLNKKFPNLYDASLIDTAVVDAFFSYLDNPQTFNPEKTGLFGYLLMSARGDLLNLLSREKNNIIISLSEDVELSTGGGEYRIEVAAAVSEESVEEAIIARTSPVWKLVKGALSDPRDQELLNLLMENVRETSEYAKILGVENLPLEEQRSIVKRHKDRIKKVIIRKIPRDKLD